MRYPYSGFRIQGPNVMKNSCLKTLLGWDNFYNCCKSYCCNRRKEKLTIFQPHSVADPDHISESLKQLFWVKILKFFHADLGIF